MRVSVELDVGDARRDVVVAALVAAGHDVSVASSADLVVRSHQAQPGPLGTTLTVALVADRAQARLELTRGVRGVLAPPDVPELLAPTLNGVAAGLLVVSPTLVEALAAPALTPREKQVLALVVMGYSNAEVAAQLVISESTVKSHLFTAYRRLGVRTRAEAVALITDAAHGFGSGILTIPRDD